MQDEKDDRGAAGAGHGAEPDGVQQNETKKLVGTWQYAMDLTQVINEEMAESYELEDLDSAAAFCVYMDFTVAEDGAYTLGVDMDATGESLTGYYQALTPVLAELVYAAGEAQGMSREEYDAALEAMGMTVEEYISTISAPWTWASC